MKSLKVCMSIVVFITFIVGSVNARTVDRIVAVVNDEVVTLSELNINVDNYMKRYEKTGQGPDRANIEQQVRRGILREMIDEKLIEQKAKKLGIAATDNDVDEVMQEMLSKKNISMQEMQDAIASTGETFEDYKNDLRQHLTRRNLLAREIKRRVTVSDEEIGNYYRENRKDYEGKAAVRIKQILIIVPKDSDAETKEKLRVRAGEILLRLKSGVSFDLMAAQVSQGPAAQTGGDLGFVEKGLMLPEVDRVAFSLGVGEMSDVIESAIGLHIITIVDKRGEGIKSFESVKEEIVEKIGKEKVEKKFEEWIREERTKAHIEIKL
jgi:peptidyl-prolyl cis-trans isomerase SurA